MNITSHQEHTFESYVEWVLFGGHIAPITKFALESVGELPPEETPAPKRRKGAKNAASFTHQDRLKSPFYMNYIEPGKEASSPLHNESSNLSKKFRRRFRVPYAMFLSICEDIRNIGEYKDGTDATGMPKVPLELFVLACLRYLGSGCPFDLLEELTCVDEETIRLFFHKHFCIWGMHAAEEVIGLPDDAASLEHVMGLYDLLGLPGCVGSIDCVHVVWDRCRAGLHNVCRGKEDYPSLAFEAVASHTRRILSVSQFFWGAVNDKSIAREDDAVRKLRSDGSFLSKVRWSSFDEDGSCSENEGAYFICDGGYHNWECMIAPFKHQMDGTDEFLWSKHVESMRKDVECVFGILKKRFLFLKHPIRLQNPEHIQNAFITCCALHNLLLDYDGFDEWEFHDVDWECAVNVEHTKLEERSKQLAGKSKFFSDAFTHSEARMGNSIEQKKEDDKLRLESERFHQRRSYLIDHYKYMTKMRGLKISLR